MMPQSPCKGCQERHLACHDSCEKFGKYREELSEYKKTVSKNKQINDYQKIACIKSRKDRGARRWRKNYINDV